MTQYNIPRTGSSTPVSLEKILTHKSLESIRQMYPSDYLKINLYVKGDIIMSDNVSKFSGDVNNSGIINTGNNNVNTININQEMINEFEKLTQELIDTINRLDIQDLDKNELKEYIEGIYEEIKSKEPKKKNIGLMFKGLLTAMDLIIKPTTLGPAWEKWSAWINNFIGG